MKFHNVSSILHGYPLIRMISRVPSHGWEIWHSGPELCASIGLLEEASPKGDVRRRDSVRLSWALPQDYLPVSILATRISLAGASRCVCRPRVSPARRWAIISAPVRSRPTAPAAATTVGWAYSLGRFYLISLVQDFCWDGSLSWQRLLRSVREERAEEDAQV